MAVQKDVVIFHLFPSTFRCLLLPTSVFLFCFRNLSMKTHQVLSARELAKALTQLSAYSCPVGYLIDFQRGGSIFL